MKPEKQRIAIAEACGIVGPFDNRWIKEYEEEGGDSYGFTGFEKNELVFIPDYLHDLNAMHQAEMVLSRGEHYNQTGGFGLYVQNLDFVRCGRKHLIEATAAERARAFLLTLGKWEEEA
jgi:hypothetical protein